MTQATETIGMKIDGLISSLESIPITYRAFVVLCCIFSYLILNDATRPMTEPQQSQVSKDVSIPKSPTKPVKIDIGPQPKWHILKILNLLAVVSLFTSFFWFASDASNYLNDSQSLVRFIAVWSVLVCYFFGFFGISFVDAEELEWGNAANDSNRPSTISPMTKAIHPPAACTPVCSSVGSEAKTAKQTQQSAKADTNFQKLSNDDAAELVVTNKIKDHKLESLFDPSRAVEIRRLAFTKKISTLPSHENAQTVLDKLPHLHSLDYSRVHGANCETVVGFIPIPVGLVGPLTLNNSSVYFPMATTEGCLVASANRGCKAISQGSGATSVIMDDGITRAPCVRMCSAKEAALLKQWCDQPQHFLKIKEAFESTTSFGKLLSIKVTVAGRNVYLRLKCFSGDAMGMNMVSKGSLAVIDLLQGMFPSLQLVALSGNMCTDKKSAAINWIEGRGKSVVVEATIPKDVVKSTLKTTVQSIISVNINKNLVGSAMAGSIGGFNAHASNIVTAVFLATGQDPAQNVESSNCITLMESTEEGDLWISCTMPSIEVGTVGGGTGLAAQSACLDVIGCRGGGENPGDNAKQLAHVIASAVMAGELSLLASLSANTLVQAHMKHNRKTTNVK